MKKLSLALLALAIQPLYAAELVNLKDHQAATLESFVNTPSHHHIAGTASIRQTTETKIKTVSEYTDPQNRTHRRVQQYYQDYPVWNAHAAIHHPKISQTKTTLTALARNQEIHKTINGKLYKGLDKDLSQVAVNIFSSKQKDAAINEAISKYKASISSNHHIEIKNTKSEVIVYIDQKNKAQWSYHISFDVSPASTATLPAKPNYVMNAVNFKIYKSWNNIKTAHNKTTLVKGGGFGGNIKTRLIYDGSKGKLPYFTISKTGNHCYLKNNEIIVKHAINNEVMNFQCLNPDEKHNNIYWSADFDKINQSHSPANDAMFGAKIVKELYRNWYNTPVLAHKDGSEQILVMNVHVPKMDNAYWDGETMTFGDGDILYPLTSLGIAAHEVSHGFTQQHSNLRYYDQSGGMNEAYSDMAAQAAEYYVYGASTWLIGAESLKLDGNALRYMDQPSRDCYGKTPGVFCSIDNAHQYYEGLDVHLSSGVYNRAFYLLSTSPGWDTKKAFAVMLHANASYWLANTEFNDGASCAIQAATDLGYDSNAVIKAFKDVGVQPEDRCVSKE